MEDLVGLLDQVRIPGPNDRIYKDECSYCFDSPECRQGLYLCLRTFVGLGSDFVEQHSQRTGQRLYLHHCRLRKRLPAPAQATSSEATPAKRPTRMAIGMEGGFESGESTTQFVVEERNTLVVMPGWRRVALPEVQLPLKVSECVAALLAADSAAKFEDAAAATGNQWDGEMRQESKFAQGLAQLDNGVKVPPSGWKCSRCELTANLWLNLTDGTILCGRRFYDGSGGNNHAVEFYKETQYPLAVKLGTITPEGADVFSYPEDDMVIDPLLAQHLAHFGIQAQAMRKTERTMAELEVALNEKYGEWSALQESEAELRPLSGPGRTGMRNLGNSCYLASVMQLLFSVPDFLNKYGTPCAAAVFFAAAGDKPMDSFNVQLAKLGCGLASGQYSAADAAQPDEEDVAWPVGVRPHMFKTLVGRGHPEFSSKRQQDAQEFLLHMFSLVERNCVGADGGANPTDAFKMRIEERLECGLSGQVRYNQRDEFVLGLHVPLEAASNAEEVAAYERRLAARVPGQEEEPPVRLRVSLDDCLRAFAADELIENFASPAAAGAHVTARKRARLASFPDHLVLQIKKFTLGADWTPKKLDLEIVLPEDEDALIDLTWLRGSGMQPGEQPLPEEAAVAPAAAPPTADATVVNALVDMGFPRVACEKAALLTGNSCLEAATNWVMEHMGDADFAVASPQQAPSAAGAAQVEVNPESVAMIESMGFTAQQATRALRATDGNTERAVDWIFSHMDELDAAEPAAPSAAEPAASGRPPVRDGAGQYRLLGFISHMGKSTGTGHYVCHIRKQGQWIIFNDEKVAASVKPPKSLAYLYFLRRADLPAL